jgi:hypothetical protein
LSYLEDLTLRLSRGIAELPEEFRARQVKYLLAAQREDGGFAGRAGGSDLYYTGFALRSLAMLGELYGPLAERAATFLRSRMSGQESIVDFLSLIYGGMLVQTAAGLDIFEQATTMAATPRVPKETPAARITLFSSYWSSSSSANSRRSRKKLSPFSARSRRKKEAFGKSGPANEPEPILRRPPSARSAF